VEETLSTTESPVERTNRELDLLVDTLDEMSTNQNSILFFLQAKVYCLDKSVIHLDERIAGLEPAMNDKLSQLKQGQTNNQNEI
jgi:hypothetical protein